MSGGQTMSTSETRIEALKLQSSAYGLCIPVVGGVHRIAGNLLWYGDFTATPNTSTDDAGGKGGGVKTQRTTYRYSASVLMAIGQGPISSITAAWVGKRYLTGGWSASQVSSASEVWVVPASGAMTYTLAHGATLIGDPSLEAVVQYSQYIEDFGTTSTWSYRFTLANGVDWSILNGVITIADAKWRGAQITLRYQYGVGSQDLTALQALGLTLSTGTLNQTAPAWLASAHPAEALAYPGMAYVHGQAYDLGTGAQVENHSFEVMGSGAYRYGSSSPDCNPWEFAAGLLTNGRYGAAMPAPQLDAADAITYAAAAGLLMSPALTEQRRASEFVEELCRHTNCAPVWSVSRLRIVPYGDVPLSANGAAYSPNITPLYDIDDDHWLADGDDAPLIWEDKEPSQRYNVVRVEFCDRTNYYNKTIAEATDDAEIATYGTRTMPTISAPWICDATVARLVAQIALQRSLHITGTGRFRLPWAYCLLEPMDLITLTDDALGFAQLPVRITSIAEDDEGMLEVEVEDWPQGVASPTRYSMEPLQGYKHNYNAAPGNVDTPVIFEAPADLASTSLEVYAAVRGAGANWGGCSMWVSLDGTNYRRAATIYGPGRYGTVNGAHTAGAATLAVQGITAGQLISGTAADASALQTLCYIGGANPEYLAYTTATLTAAGAYTLGGLVHGAYGTPAGAHANGDAFVRIDASILKSGALGVDMVGKTISIKFTSFNLFGEAEQGLADVSAYTYTITGALRGYGNGYVQAVGLSPGAAMQEYSSSIGSSVTVTGQSGTGPQDYISSVRWTPVGSLVFTPERSGTAEIALIGDVLFTGAAGISTNKAYCVLSLAVDVDNDGVRVAGTDDVVGIAFGEPWTSGQSISAAEHFDKFILMSVTAGTTYTLPVYAQKLESSVVTTITSCRVRARIYR